MAGVLLAGCGPDTRILGRPFELENQGVLLMTFGVDRDGDDKADDAVGELTWYGTTFDDPCGLIQAGGPPETGEGSLVKVEARIYVPGADFAAGIWHAGDAWVSGEQHTVVAHANEVADGATLFEAGMPQEGTLTIDAVSEDALSFTYDGAWAWSAEGAVSTPSEPPEAWTLSVDAAPRCPEPEE